MNYKMRALRERMKSLNLEGMIVTNPINIRYLTNITSEGTLLITRKENIFITYTMYIEAVNSVLTINDDIIVMDYRDITKEEYESALEALRAYRLPISVQGLNAAEILTATKSDKKMEQGKIKFVLLEKMGYAYIDKTVTDEEMKEAIEVVLEESGEEKS